MTAFFFIFSKFKKLKSKRGFLSFNFYLSILLIAFSLSAIIITDSLATGYKKEIYSKISSLNPDFTINKKHGNFLNSIDYFNLDQELQINENILFSPYLEKSAIIISKSDILYQVDKTYKQREGVYIVGLHQEMIYSNSFINKYLLYEKSDLSESEIIIGSYLAKKLNKSIYENVDIIFYDNEINEFVGKNFTIKNIYETHTQNDEFLVYTNIKSIQSNSNNIYANGVIGYYIDSKSDMITISDSNIIIRNWDSSNILKFLNTFDIPIKILMWILLFLSTYSLSLLIYNFIKNKNNDIKLLYILGYSHYSLRKIIILINLYISFIAILIGLSISYLFIIIQNKFHIISLPSERIFQLSYVPAHFDFLYFIKYPTFILLFTIFITIYVFNNFSKFNSR